MVSWQMGAVKITCVVETVIPFPEGSLLRDATAEALRTARPPPARSSSPNGPTSRSWSSAPTMPRRQLDT